MERAAHDLEVLSSSDPLAAGIQRYRDLQLAAPSASADADSDRLLAQNRRVEPAWDSVRCALGVVRRCLRKALVSLREAQRLKLPATLDGPPVDCRLLRGALFTSVRKNLDGVEVSIGKGLGPVAVGPRGVICR